MSNSGLPLFRCYRCGLLVAHERPSCPLCQTVWVEPVEMRAGLVFGLAPAGPGKLAEADPTVELTRAERVLIGYQTCPDCFRESGFYPGPEAGLSQNIKCRACGNEFRIGPGFGQRIKRG